MATWHDLVGYIRSNYRVAREEDGLLALVFGVGEGRTQLVLVTRHLLLDGSEEWVQISSPVAEVGTVDVLAVAREVGGLVCGGLAVDGNYLVIRDALPLANMQINEFERPFVLITATADTLERQFTGRDDL